MTAAGALAWWCGRTAGLHFGRAIARCPAVGVRGRGGRDGFNCELMRYCLIITWLLAAAAAHAAAPPVADLAGAIRLYDAGQYSAARQAFERLATARPDDAEINFRLGRIAMWFGDGDRGRAYLEKAARAAPDDARIQDALGDAYGMAARRAALLGKVWWARRCAGAYHRAVELDPRNPDYHWSLLRYYEEAPGLVGGGRDKARVEAAKIRDLDPAEGRIAFAVLALDEKRYADAFREFDEVLRTHPDDYEALFQVGRCAAVSGEQIERGIAALRRCLTLPPAGRDPPTPANIHYRLGNLLERKGDSAGARAEYAAMRRSDPDFQPEQDTLEH